MTANDRLIECAKNNDIEGMEKAKVDGADDYYSAFIFAANTGQLDAMRWVFEMSSSDDIEFKRIAYGIKWIPSNRIVSVCHTMFNDGIIAAADNDQLDAMRLAFEMGANNIEDVLRRATIYGQLDVIRLAIELGANPCDGVLEWAAMNGQLDSMRLLVERGATDFNGALLAAADHNQLDAMKLAFEMGATDYNGALIEGAERGLLDVIRLAIEMGADDFIYGLNKAFGEREFKAIELIIDLIMKKIESLIDDNSKTLTALYFNLGEILNLYFNLGEILKCVTDENIDELEGLCQIYCRHATEIINATN